MKKHEQLEEACLSKLEEILDIIKQRTWDTSSTELGYLHNHTIDVQESKQISGLTVKELKSIIREIVREEIQFNNRRDYYPYVQPVFQTDRTYPWWNQPVTCESKIDGIKKEQIND